MAIVAGVNIPDNKRIEISLRGIYGIGPAQARIGPILMLFVLTLWLSPNPKKE